MTTPRVLVLGGYGGTGRLFCRDILRATDWNVIIGGRNLERAEAAARQLGEDFSQDRIETRRADATDDQSIEQALEGVDLLLVAALIPDEIERVAELAAKARCHYIDILVQQSHISKLMELSSSMRDAERVMITQGGFHPGICSLFVRMGAEHFDDYRKGNIFMVMNAHFGGPESAKEIFIELGKFHTEVCREGKWRKGKISDGIDYDFGGDIGTKHCFPLQMEEMRVLPEELGLEETGVYAAGFNWFVDNFVLPLSMGLQKIKPGLGVGLCAKLTYWATNKINPPEDWVVFLLDAEGSKDGKPRRFKMIIEHEPYTLTTFPVIACLKQMLDGTIDPGTWLMGNVVDGERLLADMAEMGIDVRRELIDE